MTEYHIGMIVTGTVTGIQPYGVFVQIEEGVQGLIHISEIKPEYIRHLNQLFSVGDQIEAKIIDIDEYTHKMSLSSRAMLKQVPRRYLRKHYFTNKHKKIGFQSIQKQLPKWVDESMKDLKKED